MLCKQLGPRLNRLSAGAARVDTLDGWAKSVRLATVIAWPVRQPSPLLSISEVKGVSEGCKEEGPKGPFFLSWYSDKVWKASFLLACEALSLSGTLESRH